MRHPTRRVFLKAGLAGSCLGSLALSAPSIALGQPPLASATSIASGRRIEFGAEPTTITLALSPGARDRLRQAAAPNATATIFLNIEGVEFDQHPGTTGEIYLNLPPGVAPSRRSLRFVGSLAFFGPGRTDTPSHSVESYDITRLVKTLRARGLWSDDRITVTFALARWTRPGGGVEPLPPNVRVRIAQGTIVVQ